jgi:hypothetical protein
VRAADGAGAGAHPQLPRAARARLRGRLAGRAADGVPDAGTYARREAIFQPILAAQGRTLVEGKGTRELTERIENRVLTAPLGAP